MKNLIKNIYKNLIKFIFLKINGKILLPNKKVKNLKVSEINFINGVNLKKYKYKLYEIVNGKIFTDYVENVSIISNNFLIKDASFQQINGFLKNSENEVLKSGISKFLKKVNGSVAVLTQGASGHHNYAHWMLDIIPKIKLISNLYALNKIDYFYFTRLNSFQKQTLKLLGVESRKFIDSNNKRYLMVDKLIAVSHPYYFKKSFFNSQSKIPTWIIRYLRKEFLKKVNNPKKKIKKIFIDRSDSKNKHCKLINNEEIKKFLIKKSYKCIKLSKLTFSEQVSVFKNCNKVIAPHGAGLTNIVFCRKDTKIVEIIPKDNSNKLFKRISRINNLNYKSIYLNKIKDNLNGDIYLDLEILKKFI
tara:strand:+ start:82 stop:1161 length:1080 start_codon:yes stop_codon:yes gene_type:complete